jgi:cobalt-zinc-cadmium efflux system protein
MSGTIMAVAGLGIVINGASALLFMKGSKNDLNIRGAYLHMAADAVVSVGVVISGALIAFTGWLWLDPFVSISIGLVIVAGTWGLLRDSFNLALHAVPAHIELAAVKNFLSGIDGVKSVHDLHIWALGTNQVALSAHLFMPDGHPGDAFLHRIGKELDERFGISHATVQIELGDYHAECPLAPDERV